MEREREARAGDYITKVITITPGIGEAGNTIAYGAIEGALYIRGVVGERRRQQAERDADTLGLDGFGKVDVVSSFGNFAILGLFVALFLVVNFLPRRAGTASRVVRPGLAAPFLLFAFPMLAAVGAEEFADSRPEVERVPNSWFDTDKRLQQLKDAQAMEQRQLPPAPTAVAHP